MGVWGNLREKDIGRPRPFCVHAGCLQLTMANLKNVSHLLRLAAVFLLGLIVFLLLRGVLIPRSFGRYGHYRGEAIAEITARPISFASHQTCESCHSDVLETKVKGKHKGVACEACHGALAKHAEDPTALQPAKIDTAVLCARCHEANIAKPAGFPQVATADHSAGLACNTCHQPHSPVIKSGAAK